MNFLSFIYAASFPSPSSCQRSQNQLILIFFILSFTGHYCISNRRLNYWISVGSSFFPHLMYTSALLSPSVHSLFSHSFITFFLVYFSLSEQLFLFVHACDLCLFFPERTHLYTHSSCSAVKIPTFYSTIHFFLIPFSCPL